MTTPDESQPTLPGLELDDASRHGRMHATVVHTLEALQREGLIDDRHAAMMQLSLELADSMAMARAGNKAYAVAAVAAQLRETLLALPAPPDAGKLELFAQLVGALNSIGAQPAPQGDTITITSAT